MSTGKIEHIQKKQKFDCEIGVLMQCLAGLWWDQQRRSCVLPSEVACNPYNIINSQGQSGNQENNINGKEFLFEIELFYFIISFCLVIYQPSQPVLVPLPPYDTTPIINFPGPQGPVNVGPSMIIKKETLMILFHIFSYSSRNKWWTTMSWRTIMY